MTNLRTWLATGFLTSTIGLSGCASLTDDRAAGSSVDVTKTDSQNAHIALVQVRLIDEQNVNVSGYLTKRYQPRGAIPGQLRIQAVSSDGEVLADVTSSYHRRKANSRRSFFSQTLHVSGRQLSGVKVTHYGLGTREN
jgi:hypothetical protein